MATSSMWMLPSGVFVEQVLYEKFEKTGRESLVHSFVIDVHDHHSSYWRYHRYIIPIAAKQSKATRQEKHSTPGPPPMIPLPPHLIFLAPPNYISHKERSS